MGAYESALEALSEKELDYRKQSLYWAGKVSLLGTKDLDKAEKHLNALAGLDFGYKDLGGSPRQARRSSQELVPCG